ncbi:hypothetical protein ACJJTC_015928 [Scirpophaga incertulas]
MTDITSVNFVEADECMRQAWMVRTDITMLTATSYVPAMRWCRQQASSSILIVVKEFIIEVSNNVQSSIWYCGPRQCHGRGVDVMLQPKRMEAFILIRGLRLENGEGQPPTFATDGTSNIDIALTTRGTITAITITAGYPSRTYSLRLFNRSISRTQYKK